MTDPTTTVAALHAARDFIYQEHKGLGICVTRGCAYKAILRQIDAALAYAAPDRGKE